MDIDVRGCVRMIRSEMDERKWEMSLVGGCSEMLEKDHSCFAEVISEIERETGTISNSSLM